MVFVGASHSVDGADPGPSCEDIIVSRPIGLLSRPILRENEYYAQRSP